MSLLVLLCKIGSGVILSAYGILQEKYLFKTIRLWSENANIVLNRCIAVDVLCSKQICLIQINGEKHLKDFYSVRCFTFN